MDSAAASRYSGAMEPRVTVEGTDLLVDGPAYLDVLERTHATFEPRSYLEIGVSEGDTFRLARCPSIGVDPERRFEDARLPAGVPFTFFQQTSDAFFAEHAPRRLFGRPVDLAFLDGMHQFDFLLRDFINTERVCARGSMIVLHDCLPGDAFMTRPWARVAETAPTRFPNWWAGDVWKMVPLLREFRPDLEVVTLDAIPTGLVVIRRLDPSSRVLEGRYDDLVAHWSAIDLEGYGVARLLAVAAPRSSEAWLARLQSIRWTSRVKRKARSAAIRAGLALHGRPQPKFSWQR